MHPREPLGSDAFHSAHSAHSAHSNHSAHSTHLGLRRCMHAARHAAHAGHLSPRGGDPFAGGFGHRGGRFGAGFGRGGGRMFDHGDLRLLVLALVSTAPRHGYELIKLIEDKFGGAYAPSPGAIYPTLALLEEQDLIAAVAESAGAKRRYAITDAGRAYLADNQAAVDGLLNRIEVLSRMAASGPPPERILQAMNTLKRVLLERSPNATQAEIERIAATIERAARDVAEGR